MQQRQQQEQQAKEQLSASQRSATNKAAKAIAGGALSPSLKPPRAQPGGTQLRKLSLALAPAPAPAPVVAPVAQPSEIEGSLEDAIVLVNSMQAADPTERATIRKRAIGMLDRALVEGRVKPVAQVNSLHSPPPGCTGCTCSGACGGSAAMT
eukprot:COSAG05_NODE_951_length_6466_cov_130.129417_7_plen_152_part_00